MKQYFVVVLLGLVSWDSSGSRLTAVDAMSDTGSSSNYDSANAPPPPPRPTNPADQNDPQQNYWYGSRNSQDGYNYYGDPSRPQQSSFEQHSQAPPEQAYYDESSSYSPQQQEQQYFYSKEKPPPPPQQPPKSTTTIPKMPIHYEFPAATNKDGLDLDRDEDEVGEKSPMVASARKDLVTRYMSTKVGKVQVMASSTVVGASLGAFLGKSFLPLSASFWAGVCSILFFVGNLVRTPFGELTRALGLSIVLVLQRTSNIRKTYPTWRYIPGCLGMTRRARPFPPARNPWRYTPRRKEDVEFNMMYSIIAMAFVGSACGGNIQLPIVPTSIGALGGAAVFAFGCTLSSNRGDLCRTMGMRVVSMIQELWDIQDDLKIIPKTAVVSGQVLDRLLIFDRKHKVKDRFLSLVTKGYDQAMSAASGLNQQQVGPGDEDDGDSDRDRLGKDRDDDRDSRRNGRNDYRRRPARDDKGVYGRRPFGRDDFDGRRRGKDGGGGGRFRDGDDYNRGRGDENRDKEETPKRRGFFRR